MDIWLLGQGKKKRILNFGEDRLQNKQNQKPLQNELKHMAYTSFFLISVCLWPCDDCFKVSLFAN